MVLWQWILFGVDVAALLCATVLCVLMGPKHTTFPDVRVGYHTKAAMQSAAAWEYACRTAAKLCVWAGFPLLVVAPLLRWGLWAPVGIAVAVQIACLLTWALVVALLPNIMARRLFPGGGTGGG